MKIPEHGFGYRTPEPQRIGRQPSLGGEGVGAAIAGIGADVNRRGQQMLQENIEEKNAEWRIKASKALAERELALATVDSDIELKLRSGEIKHDQAESVRNEAIGKLQSLDLDGAPPEIRAHVDNAVMQMGWRGQLRIRESAQKARIGAMQTDIRMLLDAQSKKAGLPGANVDGINASIDAMDADGRLAFGHEWDIVKSQFREGNYMNHVQQRLMEAGDDHGALKQLEHDLSAEDGYYSDKIDAGKRLSLQNNISNNISRIEQRNEMLAMKREMRAQAVVGDIEKQNASGIPPTPDMLGNWMDMAKGTASEAAVVGMIKQGEQIQTFLRAPIGDQQTIMQQLEANLKTNGGSVEDKQLLDRMRGVFEQNQKTLTDTPLVYAMERLGADVEPLDFSAATTPGRENEVFTALRDRASMVAAISEKNGAQVKRNLLLPQEADELKAQLSTQSPEKRRELLEGLRKSSGDEKTYTAIMDQIAPDKPVSALAGKLAAKQASTVLDAGGWFSDKKTAGSRDVSATLLKGEALLADEKKFPMPKQDEFNAQFDQFLNGAFANAPKAYGTASQAVKAYYAARASEEGLVSEQVDSKLMQEAVRAVIGEPVEHNGKTVLAPWGMDSDTFIEKAGAQYEQLGLSVDFDDVTLLPAGNGRYGVASGRSPLLKDGRPVVIEVR